MVNAQNYQNISEKIIPFQQALGLRLEEMKDRYSLIRILFKKELVGDPCSNRIYGGVISAAMDAVGREVSLTACKFDADRIVLARAVYRLKRTGNE